MSYRISDSATRCLFIFSLKPCSISGIEALASMRRNRAISLEQFPYEILLEIIIRIPAKSLAQFRFASKFWYALLNDPKVIDTHFHHAKEKPSYVCAAFTPEPIMDDELYPMYQYRVSLVEMIGSNVHVEHYMSGVEVLGSAGGLMVCQDSRKHLEYIANPIIGDYVKVPPFEPLKPQPPLDCRVVELLFFTRSVRTWGFGYSTRTKEYKLVKICSGGLFGHPIVLRGAVLTLGSESWREIPDVPYEPLGQAVDCDGTLFWIIGEVPEGKPQKNILSFDIVSEKFQSWTWPSDAFPDEIAHRRLAKVGDSVACVASTESNCVVSVLRDNVWVNRYRIVGMEGFTFVELGIGNELLLVQDVFKMETKVYSYDVKSGKSRAISPWPYFKVGYLHVASLVSPSRIV